jgi:hypothetical protein
MAWGFFVLGKRILAGGSQLQNEIPIVIAPAQAFRHGSHVAESDD